jgi:hypothetical protein
MGSPDRADVTTTELLKQRLELVFDWYGRMVNPETGMLEYLYIPQEDHFVRENCPIRDIASVWDAELLGEFLNKQELRPLIATSLRHFDGYLVDRNGCAMLDSARLGEASTIAHSAFMMLGLLHAPPPRPTHQIAALAEGILQQQRTDGSYKVCFEDLPDHGEELYAGEAMLALLEAYRQLRDTHYLESAARGFSYYDAHYFRRGRVGDDLLIFFANWQSQACRFLFECTPTASIKHELECYVFGMHDRIIDRGFYRDVEIRPARQASVEVACALEGLNDAYSVARALDDERAERYCRCICTGLKYLLTLQCTDSGSARERGGFGVSLSERAQRIDITGHAASALMKSVENGIECG